jgi:hypothetical protein
VEKTRDMEFKPQYHQKEKKTDKFWPGYGEGQ